MTPRPHALPFLALLVLATGFFGAAADAAEMNELSFQDMDAFRPQAGNWSIVGSVFMNPDVDTHRVEELAQLRKAVTATPGEGILLNMNTDAVGDHLLTRMEHGDIEIETEVMLPRGSNSGLYLQGRYEVQLLDSWGAHEPRYSDIGGIYRNWKEDPEEAFRGVAPRVNASKAPGLWQTLHLAFRAPRFDSNGKKTANARFDFIDLNGVRIHENVEVPRLTGGSISEREAARGPIMIQGDHGPVAFRNFRYRLLEPAGIRLADLSYEAFHGKFKTVSDFAGSSPVASGQIPEIDVTTAGVDDAYGLSFTGELVVDQTDDYTFELKNAGGALLSIDGETLVDQQYPDATGTHQVTRHLEKGVHQFELHNFKAIGWVPPRLALSVKGSGTHRRDLHAVQSFPAYRQLPRPIFVEPQQTPRLHRGFFDAFGERHSHTIAVGDPAGAHYVFDLEGARPLAAWRGPFLNATPMWHDRGNGTFRARGAVAPLLSRSLFPVNFDEQGSAASSELRFHGYRLEGTSGRPVFLYTFRGQEYTVELKPDRDGKRLICRIAALEPKDDEEGSVQTPPASIDLLIAEGSSIEAVSENRFAVDGQRLFVEAIDGSVFSKLGEQEKASLHIQLNGYEPAVFAITW